MSAPSTPTSIVLAINGLILNPSTFDPNAQNGSLTVADNVVIDRPSVVETRRGFNNAFSTLTHDGALSIFQYNSTKLINTSDSGLYSDPLSNGVLSAYSGTYPVPDPANTESRVRGIEVNKNFYFITEDGTYRLDRIAGQPRLAGSPPGLSGTGTTTGATGFMPNNTNIAYRVVFGYIDFNKQLVLGAPSSRIIVTNTSGTTANTNVVFQVPKEIRAAPLDFFFQVYRGNASPNLVTQPDDEMALAYEDICSTTVTPIDSDGNITILDNTDSSLLGAALYTNQGQEGILQSNYRPPWALDVSTYKQYAFYANTRTLMTSNLTLLSAGAGGSAALTLLAGDTITFQATESGGASFILTGVAGVNNPALGWFHIETGGTAGYNIQTTAMNIALVANGFASNTFLTAYYVSSDQDLPGQMRFERLTLTADTFNITSSKSQCWEQNISDVIPVVSTNDARANRIYYSKFNQPEAVPLVNYLEFGSVNQPIRKIVPLRDGVMVLKDDGVFRLSGSNPLNFAITPINYNLKILAANTAAELDNKVYFLSDQGVIALGDSDSAVMSFVLDRTIIENTSPTLFPNLKAVAWGVAYQSDRKYIMFMPSAAGDTQATLQYVYNHLTQVWTNWTLAATCGIVFRPDGRLYLGSEYGSANDSGDSFIYQERKTFTTNDYADNEYSTACITSGTTATIDIITPVLPPGVVILPGWTVVQESNGAKARVLTATDNGATTTLVLDAEQDWALVTLKIYTPVYSEIQTIQLDCDNPAMNKQFTEMVYIFTEQGFSQITAALTSNTSSSPALDYLVPSRSGGWGLDPWGPTPWGGTPAGQGKVRRIVPQAIQRAGWLYLNMKNAEAFTKFGFSGFELFYKPTNTRQK